MFAPGPCNLSTGYYRGSIWDVLFLAVASVTKETTKPVLRMLVDDTTFPVYNERLKPKVA